MRKGDLVRAIDAILPDNALREKVLALPARSRPRLENPLKHVLALGTAALMCAGVVAAVLALQNMAAPGGKSAGSAPNTNTALAAVPESGTPVPSPSETPGLEPVLPRLSPEQVIGADMAELDYASDDVVIFHGYFGLFVYDLHSKKIVRSVDLKPIGCDATQGDDFCEVAVSADGNTVQLHPVSSKNMYVYAVSDNTLIEKAYEDMGDRFAGFVDSDETVGHLNDGFCSYRAVRFGTDEYGYLYTVDWKIGTLAYVRGDTVYKLFDGLANYQAPLATETPIPTPEPTPSSVQPDATALMQTTYVPGTDTYADKRNFALGNVCKFMKAEKTDGGVDYVFHGQTTEGLTEYCDRYYKVGRNNPKKCELDPIAHPDLIFVLVDGQVDKDFVGTTISEVKLNLLIAANEDNKQYGVYTRGMLGGATIEFSDDWETFTLTIHNTNPDFHPTTNFTILTRYAPDGVHNYTVADYASPGSKKVQYYALPVGGK